MFSDALCRISFVCQHPLRLGLMWVQTVSKMPGAALQQKEVLYTTLKVFKERQCLTVLARPVENLNIRYW